MGDLNISGHELQPEITNGTQLVERVTRPPSGKGKSQGSTIDHIWVNDIVNDFVLGEPQVDCDPVPEMSDHCLISLPLHRKGKLVIR